MMFMLTKYTKYMIVLYDFKRAAYAKYKQRLPKRGNSSVEHESTFQLSYKMAAMAEKHSNLLKIVW